MKTVSAPVDIVGSSRCLPHSHTGLQEKLAELQGELDARTEELEYYKNNFKFFKDAFDKQKETVKKMKKMRAPPHKVRRAAPPPTRVLLRTREAATRLRRLVWGYCWLLYRHAAGVRR